MRALLERWVEAFEQRDPAAVRAVLSDHDGFVWLEDGELRYPNPESIVSALESFPSDLAIRYQLSDIGVLPIDAENAWAHLRTETDIRQGGTTVSSFGGVVSMLTERSNGEWRIVAAHTSNLRVR